MTATDDDMVRSATGRPDEGFASTVTEAPAETPPMPPEAEERAADVSSGDVTLADVRAARERIGPHLPRTPLVASRTLSRMCGADLRLKVEAFQRTGSFKSRGALNAVLLLTPEQRARGVVTLSAGNHGQGLAFAAGMVGARCVVFMPETAIPTKVEAIKGYGAEARFAPTMADVFPAMEAFRREHGLTFVHPFSDPAIIAGQGTVALEILEDAPDVETVIVPVGGGGLLAGVALTLKGPRPEVRVVGVEPEGSAAVSRSLASGELETLATIETIADGLAAPFAGPLSQAIIERFVDDVVLVTDEEIVTALRLILERAKVLVEPAGAAGVAALLNGAAGLAPGTAAVATLSGGNIDSGRLRTLL